MRRQTVIPLYINSVDRTNINDQPTDYTISLRKPLRNIVSISVTNVVIPISYNEVNRNNNTINAYIFIGVSNISTVVYTPLVATIINGNYTPTQLAAAFQTAMNNSPTSISYGFTYGVTYDPITFRMTLVVTNPNGTTLYTWGIEFTYTQCLDIIGIGFGGTGNQTYTASPNSNTLSIPCGRTPASGEPYNFNITSNLLTNGINTSYVSSLTKIFNVTQANQRLDFTVQESLTEPSGSPIPFPTDASGGMYFGQVVGISHDGNITISQALSYDLTSCFVFTRAPQSTTWEALTAPILGVPDTNGAPIRSGGNSISGDGNTMALGVPYVNSSQGGAMMFRRVGYNWVFTTTIVPDPTYQLQGLYTSISADGLVVSINGTNNNWVFRYVANAWVSDGPKLYAVDTSEIRYQSMSDDGKVIAIACVDKLDIFVYVSGWTLGTSLSSLTYPSVSVVGMSAPYTLAYSNNFSTISILSGSGGFWFLQAIISNPRPSANFGYGLDLSSDGSTLSTTNPVLRELYIYKVGVPLWTLEATFTGVNGTQSPPSVNGQNFASTALSADGTVLIAGSPWDQSDANGVSYIYKKTGASWLLADSVTNESSAGALSKFGYSMSISGNYAAIGGNIDGAGGSVFIYKYSNGWTEYGLKIEGGVVPGVDTFGDAVAIATLSEDNAFVIASNYRSTTVGQIGTVSMYQIIPGDKIYIRDFPGAGATNTSAYGSALAISANSNHVLVGGYSDNSFQGKVWYWFFDGSTWNQLVLLPPLIRFNNRYGLAVEFSSSVFAIMATTYVVISSFTPFAFQYVIVDLAIAHPGIYFTSMDIAMDDSTIIVGAEGYGALVINSEQIVTPLLTYPSIAPVNVAGQSVSISDDALAIVIGDPSYNGNRGGTYVYRYELGVWTIFGDIATAPTDTAFFNSYQGSKVAMFGNSNYLTSAFKANNTSGVVWYFSAGPAAETPYSLNILEPSEVLRSLTVFGLRSIFNFTLAPFLVMVADLIDDKYMRLTLQSGTGATFIVSKTSTFKSFLWPSNVLATKQQSEEIDFSINNNIVKSSVNTVSTVFNGFFTDSQQNENYRVYPAGYTLQNLIDIQLRDERDRIIDLNGANWTCVLLATIAN